MGGEIKGMPCTDDAVSIKKSTPVDDGDKEWPPLPTLGMLRMLGCNLKNRHPRKLSNCRKGGNREACCCSEEESIEGHERRAGWYDWSKLCDGVGGGIKGMPCNGDDVLLGISTIVDDGGSLGDRCSPWYSQKASKV